MADLVRHWIEALMDRTMHLQPTWDESRETVGDAVAAACASRDGSSKLVSVGRVTRGLLA